jgi:cyclopropane fatty-acyl-phospholipid synthase-like methyltransferase
MKDGWLDMWNDRYGKPEFAYGVEPNEFFAEQLKKLTPGKILLGAEGEGRNAVHAALQDWEVHAFDISHEARNKATRLATTNNVEIDYQVGELPELDFQKSTFDAVSLIYAHFPKSIRSQYHQIIGSLIKKDGTLILEAFGPKHITYREKNPAVGGPGNMDLLFSQEEIQQSFPEFEILQLEELEITLNEGLYHNGQGSVVRFVGRKK